MKHEGNSLVHIEHKDRHIETKYFLRPRARRYLCWVIPTHQARDLGQWWNSSGMHLRTRDLPVSDCRFGSVAVQMCTSKRVDVYSALLAEREDKQAA
jgi:hypothetical protein